MLLSENRVKGLSIKDSERAPFMQALKQRESDALHQSGTRPLSQSDKLFCSRVATVSTVSFVSMVKEHEAEDEECCHA